MAAGRLGWRERYSVLLFCRLFCTPAAAVAWIIRRLLVDSAPPDPLVESGRGATRNGDGIPILARQNPGNQYDLADMVAAMGQRALDRQWHGVGFSPNENGFFDIGWSKTLKSLEKSLPAGIPEFDQLVA